MTYPKRSQYKYAKSRYRVRNWREYEVGLQRRGDLTVSLGHGGERDLSIQDDHRPGMRSRTLEGQRVEAQLACRILNTMTRLGMPDSYRVG